MSIQHTQIEADLIDAIRAQLRATYQAQDGSTFQGQAISYLKSELEMNGWRGLGTLGEFQDRCEWLGFAVRHGKPGRWLRNGWRFCGGFARVVTGGTAQ
jgi:hypothetical protein